MQKVLIIDDNPAIGQALSVLFQLHDISSHVVYSPQAGIAAVSEDPDIALVIQDMNFSDDTTSGIEGEKLFFMLREAKAELPIVLLTAWTHLETAVELVKQGAADYLAKPWDDQKLLLTVSRLLELQALRQQNMLREKNRAHSRHQLSQSADLCGVIYDSDQMHHLIQLAIKIARTDVPVLISGPNGAGKEKIAQIVQRNSSRSQQAFICVNAGALPNDLIEAELFGAEAGAYTGLNKTRIGRFEAADGGTLFLDELGNLSAGGQAKLLRVLQTGEYERLGSSQTRKCDVRLISATNANLKSKVSEGSFREDLYYRLNVFELEVPALNQRREDILPLLCHFLGENVHLEKTILQALQSYPWPGNIRELENACKRASIMMVNNHPRLDDFSVQTDTDATISGKLTIEPSRELIEKALKSNNGVVAKAARQLGMTRQSLYRRMDQYGIQGR